YRYVLNAPTMYTDPTGNDKKPIASGAAAGAVAGGLGVLAANSGPSFEVVKETSCDLKNNTFPFNNGKGTVQAYKDVTVKHKNGRVLDGWVRFELKADVDIPEGTHWLQFFYVEKFDENGNKVRILTSMIRVGKDGEQVFLIPSA